MNMPMQNQISINSMNMPTQNQFNINSMNMPTQNQFNVSYMNMPTQNQMNMNMNMYNMSNQNNIMNNNILYMNMPQIQAPYNCNPQYNPNYNNQPFNVINNQQNIITNEVSIIDCFEYDKRDNEMSGDNAMYCGKCKAKCNSIMNTNLETGPEVLILLLNRGKGIEFDVKIKFEENLDLENYIENKKYSRKYKLIGVITHIGDNSQDGHFISYCREPIENGEWTKYNDAFVSKVEDFKKEVIDFAMPYVLFYQRENN
jgi:ubiquitin C-terminal hydrolase